MKRWVGSSVGYFTTTDFGAFVAAEYAGVTLCRMLRMPTPSPMRSVDTAVTSTPSSSAPLPRRTPCTHAGVMSDSLRSRPSPDSMRSTIAMWSPFETRLPPQPRERTLTAGQAVTKGP